MSKIESLRKGFTVKNTNNFSNRSSLRLENLESPLPLDLNFRRDWDPFQQKNGRLILFQVTIPIKDQPQLHHL